jgi:hypothetical protein
MFRTSWRRLILSLFRPTIQTIRKRVGFGPRRGRLRLEHLEDRLAPAVTASFNSGLLTVKLDAAGDTANIAVVSGNVEVRDGGNVLKISQAANTVTDISAAGNNLANQTVNLNSDFVFADLNSLSAGMVTTTNLNGNVTTAGDQSYTSAVGLGADVKLTAKDVTFMSTVDGAHALEVASTTSTTFGGEVGAGTKLTTLTLDAGGPTAVNTDMVLTSSDQTFNTAVTLGASATFGISSMTGKLTFASTVAAGANNLTLTADTISLNGLAKSVSGTGKIAFRPANASDTIGIAGATGTLQVTNTDLQALKDGFSLIAIGRDDGSGAVTTNMVSFSDPVLIESPQTGGIIKVAGQITGMDNASITLTGPGTTTDLNANIVTAGTAITINDSVSLTSNVLLDTTNGGATGAAIHITGKIDADMAANNRTLTLTAGGGDIALDSAIGSAQSLGSLTVNSANKATFGGTIQTSGDVTQTAGTGTTTFNGTSGTGIGGKLSVTTNVIQLKTAKLTTVGAASLTANSDVTVNSGLTAGAVSITANGDVTLNAVVDAGAGTVSILANQGGTGINGFTQNTGGDITTTNATANAVSISVASGVTGAALQNITVGSGGTISVNANNGSITQAAGTLSAGTGTVTLTTGGLTSGIGTLAANINTSAAAINGTAGSGGAFITNANSGNFAVTATGTGNIQLISTMGTLTIAGKTATPMGNITLCSQAGSIAVNATLAAEGAAGMGGTVRLSSSAGVTQTTAITAINLGVRAGDDIALDQATNSVSSVFAANNSGSLKVIRFLDGNSFSTGTVDPDSMVETCFTTKTIGVTSTNGDITLCAQNGALSLGAAVNAGTNNIGTDVVRLMAGGDITQSAVITATDLAVQASGAVQLCGVANQVSGHFAASGAGVAFQDGLAFHIGTILGVANTCFTTTTSGISGGNGDITLASGGDFNVDTAISTSGTVRLAAGGAVSQTNDVSASISAANLGITANGNVTLDGSATMNNVSGSFATQIMGGGFVHFRDVSALGFTVGQVSGAACFAGATGVTTTGGGEITLSDAAGSANLSINNVITAAGNGRVLLTLGNAIMQLVSAAITGGSLGLSTGGSVSLGGAANAVGTLAAMTGGALAYQNGQALTVGSVNGTPGINSGGNNVTLMTTAGMLTIGNGLGEGIMATGATVDLNASGVMENPMSTTPAKSTITGSEARLQGTGTFTLNQANAVGMLAAGVTGALTYMNDQALMIATVDGTPGINSGGNNVTLMTTAGMLTIGSSPTAGEGIMATGSTVDLSASGVMENNASAITSMNARFEGTGMFALGDPMNTSTHRNAISAMAATVTGQFTLMDTSSLTAGMMDPTGAMHPVTTNGGNLMLMTDDNFTVMDEGMMTPTINTMPTTSNGVPTDQVMVETGLGSTTTQVTIDIDGEIAAGKNAMVMGGQKTRMIGMTPVPVANTFKARPGHNGTVTELIGNFDNLNHNGGDTLVLKKLTNSGVKKVHFIPGADVHSGTFVFSADPWETTYTNIGVIQGETIQATSVQESNDTVKFVLNGSLSGAPLEGVSMDFSVTVNPFLLSPVFSSPPGSFSVPAPRVAVADVNGDGFQDLILASGPGSRPTVAVIDGQKLAGSGGNMLHNSDLIGGQPFFPFAPDAATGGFFTGGLNVAAGDISGSGAASIVLSEDTGGSPTVRVFKFNAAANTFTLTSQFTPYDSSFHGGVRLAVGDNSGTHMDPPVNGRTIVDKPIIVVAPGPGAALPVIVFDATTLRILAELTPYGTKYQDGIYVAAGNYLRDSFFLPDGSMRPSTSNDIVTAPQAGQPLIKVYDGENLPQLLTQVVAFQPDQANVVTSTNLQLTTGFMFKATVPAPAFGTNSVAMGPINLSTGTRDLIVTTGIGQRAVQSTISVNSSVNGMGKRIAAQPSLPPAKRSMFFRARSPRGVNVSSH